MYNHSLRSSVLLCQRVSVAFALSCSVSEPYRLISCVFSSLHQRPRTHFPDPPRQLVRCLVLALSALPIALPFVSSCDVLHLSSPHKPALCQRKVLQLLQALLPLLSRCFPPGWQHVTEAKRVLKGSASSICLRAWGRPGKVHYCDHRPGSRVYVRGGILLSQTSRIP